jgi:hypothetical protein
MSLSKEFVMDVREFQSLLEQAELRIEKLIVSGRVRLANDFTTIVESLRHREINYSTIRYSTELATRVLKLLDELDDPENRTKAQYS